MPIAPVAHRDLAMTLRKGGGGGNPLPPPKDCRACAVPMPSSSSGGQRHRESPLPGEARTALLARVRPPAPGRDRSRRPRPSLPRLRSAAGGIPTAREKSPTRRGLSPDGFCFKVSGTLPPGSRAECPEKYGFLRRPAESVLRQHPAIIRPS